MSVSGTDKSYSSGLIDTSSITRKPTQQLGQDAFLQILVAQMANQDPMEPMKDTEFIAQMAQFSALEQMQALNQSFINNQAYNMVGKGVIASTYVENKETKQYEKVDLMGVVSGVQNVNGKAYLIVGEYLIDPSSVSETYDNTGNNVVQNGNLIGKQVTASLYDEEGNKTDVNGIISKVFVKDGVIYAKVGEKEVPVSSINSIEEVKVNGDTETDKNTEVDK